MIILASSSPRRVELLKKLNKEFIIISPDFDESKERHPIPSERVKRLALGKANWVYKNKANKDDLILAADTIVYCNKKVFNKPTDRQDAYQMLKKLSNNVHEVYTGICIIYKDKLYLDYAVTKVYFKELTDKEINDYLDTKEPYDKAGAYAIQGIAKKFINFIDGSLDNVVGLPTELIKEYFIKLGLNNEEIK